MAKEKDEFNLNNLPPEVNDPEISKDDFKLVQVDAKIHDQKFQTKPTTFIKDCFKRFCKNKSSVVAAFILGFLLILSVLVPVIGKSSEVHETDVSHPTNYYLEPKLFNAGTGFWDGTKKLVDIPVNPETGYPSDDYVKSAISNLEVGEEQYTKKATDFGKDGYVQFGYYQSFQAPEKDKDGNLKHEYIVMAGKKEIESYDFDSTLKITNFDVYDQAKLEASDEKTKTFPEGYVGGKAALFFKFEKDEQSYEFALTDYKSAHNIGLGEDEINVTSKFNAFYEEHAIEKSWTNKVVKNPVIQIRLLNENTETSGKNTCVLIKSIKIDAKGTNSDFFNALSFESGTACMIRKATDDGMWENKDDIRFSRADIYLSKATLCSFTYDTYEAALGTDEVQVPISDIEKWVEAGYLKFESGIMPGGTKIPSMFVCEILDEGKCPLAKPFTQDDLVYNPSSGRVSKVNATVMKYKTLFGLESMPKFLMGTDQTGRDMFIYVFEGLRTSLLLGIATTVICFLFGLLWGSVSGYFGGNVDLVMERFTDILAGIPWIVVMTLTIIHLGSNFLTFALALCLTGWIGTAATTRTQFYRFRGREYVLASRTLGASHGRLIAKHILPNAMGTIITSAVLMVPSVIFSEATISYLGLGFKNLASLGVILSDNQIELTNHPYLLIFPSIIIALLMISFNLFGNGLRDAVNPSLKGEGE